MQSMLGLGDTQSEAEDGGRGASYRVFHDTGHPQILSQALYKRELDTWKFSKCLIL